MRLRLLVWLILLCWAPLAPAQVSIGVAVPGLSIGINVPTYPAFVPIPGYPVYYAPRLYANYFFYDGMYWVYVGDNWYESYWYNGPWWVVPPLDVPLYILRIPVRYYRRPPPYFRGWRLDAPPRWGEHWGREWELRRHGWEKWNRRSVPARAPLPAYQRNYSGNRYPGVEQQRTLQDRHYRYQPRDPSVRERYQQQKAQGDSMPSERGRQPAVPQRGARESESPTRSIPPQAPPHGGRYAPPSQPPQSRERGSRAQGAVREPARGQGNGRENGHGKNEDRR